MEEERAHLLETVDSKGWGIVERRFAQEYEVLLARHEAAENESEAWARVNYSKGFGRALELLEELSRREGGSSDEFEVEVESDGDALRKAGRARHVRVRRLGSGGPAGAGGRYEPGPEPGLAGGPNRYK